MKLVTPLLFVVGVFAVLLGSTSCGAATPGRIAGKAALEADKSQLATENNVSAWAPTWVRGEWILTIGDDPFRAPNETTWRNAVAKSLVQAAGIAPSDLGFSKAVSEIGANLKMTVNRLPFDSLPQLLQGNGEPPLGFLHVRVEGGESFLRSIDSPLSFPVELERLDALERLARWQAQALGDVPGVVWAEPNLLSELFDVRTASRSAANAAENGASPLSEDADPAPASSAFKLPPEFGITSLMVELLKRVQADVGWEEAFKLVQSRNSSLAQVNVAVLDTGVDYFHPELRDAMYVNPGEIQGNGIDDDGNGHIDDIHGINATVDNSADDTVEPRPGAADLRGPGQACPTAIGNVKDSLTSNCGHGTHVAGIIAAKAGGNLSTLGICPSCKIISIRVSERCLQPATERTGECKKPKTPYDPSAEWEVDGGIADISQIRGLNYLLRLYQKDSTSVLATNVVNMSLGKYFRSRAMGYIIRKLDSLNIVVVAAAGNDNTDTPSYPAAYASVVSVCATGNDGHRGEYGKAIFSNYGDWVDICAPGVDVYAPVPGTGSDGSGRFDDKSGTSQATPFVAGAVGHLLATFRNSVSPSGLVRRMKAGANYRALYSAEYNTLYRACYAGTDTCDHLLGSGMLDLGAAVQGAQGSTVGESNGRQVSSGCVVSSIGAKGPFLTPHAASSLPFTLLIAWLVWRGVQAFARVLGVAHTRRARRKTWRRT